MSLPASQTRLTAQPPPPWEPVLVLGLATALSLLTAISMRPLLRGSPYSILTGWAAHLVQLLLPWVWYRLRVAPALPPERRSLLRWRRTGTRLFCVMAGWIFLLKSLIAVAEAMHSPAPGWALAGPGPVALALLLEGVLVGLSEEMLFRPAFHLPLSLTLAGKTQVGRWELSHALLWTALAFGLFHLPNMLLGQPVAATVTQALSAAVVGLFFGYYYERTDNYLGAALLHNLLDVLSSLAVLLVLAVG